MADSGGETSSNLLWIFIIIAVLFLMWFQNGGIERAKKGSLFYTDSSFGVASSDNNKQNDNQDFGNNGTGDGKYSPYHSFINLQSGSAQGTYQPGEEYITISAYGNKNPINIGGWTLRNGRDKKKYVVYGSTYQGQSVTATIPNFGFSLYQPYNIGLSRRSAITLKDGEQAVIITGKFPTFGDVKNKGNFKVNKCLGYLEDKNDYRFTPPLYYQCPSPRDLPGFKSLDDVCYNFVQSINTCHQPKDVYVRDEGYCLDGNCQINSYCRNLVTQNLNLDACFNRYSKDKDFVGKEWRVYLGQTWELWESSRETISLYDKQGLLVSEISY